jgi:glycosyltransferase involved in cell wall biosynthesis
VKLAYVVPRYGAAVIGGAEYGARMLAERLVALAGWEVEVLTTQALDARTWADELPGGSTVEAGVTVHRFPVTGTRHPHFDRLSPAVLGDPEGASGDAERRWIDRQGPVSPGLLDAVRSTDADLVAFYPYLYHPTVAGVPLAAGRAVMHPAAHDEPPLRLPLFREVFGQVDGFVFQTDGERTLVEGLFPIAHRRQVVLGLGVEPAEGDRAAAAEVLGLGERPYLVCVGRVDDGKGTRTLARFFAAYKERHPGPLALALLGPVVDAPDPHPDIVVTGPVSEDVKWGALRAATALVNPSGYEAFSLVLVEAWSAGIPVVVNDRCAATSEHVALSGGGLAFGSYAAFEVVIERLTGDAALRAAMARRGQDYVTERFLWPAVIDRYTTFLEGVRG